MSATPLSLVPVFMGLALHITGCAVPLSPQAQCFAEATVEYRVAWRAAQEVRADLDRGYALHRVTARRAAAVPCRVAGRLTTCLHDGHDSLTLPAPIDRPALENRLDLLQAQMDQLRPLAMERAAPCGYGEQLAEIQPARARP